jgi:hypothetical protein
LTNFVYNSIISDSSEKDPFLNRSTRRTFFLLLIDGENGASFKKAEIPFLNLLSWKVDNLFN